MVTQNFDIFKLNAIIHSGIFSENKTIPISYCPYIKVAEGTHSQCGI